MTDLDQLRAMWHAANSDKDRDRIQQLAADIAAENRPLIEWALHYAAHGIPIFPVYEPRDGRCTCNRGDDCHSPAKHPRTGSGFKDATTDPAQIEAWWTRWPDANIGAPTGSATFTVIDVDTPGGYDSIHYVQISDRDTVGTWHDRDGTGRVATPSGGAHLHMPADTPLKTGTAILPSVDARGDGGYVLMPPSRGTNGRRYQWVTDTRGLAEIK